MNTFGNDELALADLQDHHLWEARATDAVAVL